MLIFFALLLLTIVVHEAGHLIAALLCGVKVDAFCIGFFKPYLHIKYKGIDWRITPWLIGGYCALSGELKKVSGGLLIQPYWKKMCVVLAGVFVNLLIAIVCYIINYGSVLQGLLVDYEALKFFFTKDPSQLIFLLDYYQPNFILLQFSLLNITSFITNIIPLPALDGGFIWLFLMEPIWKENFEKYLQITVKVGFLTLMLAQVVFLVMFWGFFL